MVLKWRSPLKHLKVAWNEREEIQPLLSDHNQFSSVQSLNCVRLFATPWIAACQASLSITNSRSLLKLMSIESVMPSSHLILCRPLLLLPPIPPRIRVFLINKCQNVIWKKILIRKKERANWILVWSNCPEESQKLSEIQYYIVEHSIRLGIFWFIFMSNWKAQNVE